MSQITITEADINNAFEQKLFEVLYQPQMCINNDGKVIGAEAFVQLNHPEHGQVKASQFTPLIDQMGLMKELTGTVTRSVAQDLSEWISQGNNLRIAINVPLSLFSDGNLIDDISHILRDANIPLNLITLEISQAGQSEVSESMLETFTNIRMKGFRIALDGFGFSPRIEEQLPELPIDEVKIHRDILTNINKTDDSEKVVKHALHLAASLGIQVIAVGVENEAQLNWLTSMGCDNAQGYFFGLPMLAKDFNRQILEKPHIFTLDSATKRLRLLIIEDDNQQRELLSEMLGELFDLSIAGSAAEAIALFESHRPELLVIDVNLPDGSGIDLCKEFNQGEYKDSFSALFISGEDTMQNRLRAYEAGGTDYISKPVIITELIAKLGRLAIQQSRRHQLSENVAEFQSVALQSMQEAAHYGDIVQFFKNLITSRDEQAIANELFGFLSRKDLKGSVQFTNGESFSTYDQCNATPSPIEMNVFELLRSKGRLFDFGKRTIVNDKHVSFLVKNMPEDEIEHGKARDYIAVMIEGMEARYRDILRDRLIKSVFTQLQSLTQEMSTKMKKDAQKQIEALDYFSIELKMSFHALDLTNEQEEHISGIVEKMLDAKDESESTTCDIDHRLQRILSEVSVALEDLEQKAPEVQESLSSDVDLF